MIWQIRQAVAHIERHYSNSQLTLSDLAQLTGLSVSHLSRSLKDLDGVGFRERLQLTRTRAARQLLLHTTLSVKEVAAAVGYAHASHLCRHFRRHYGKTPRTMRAEVPITDQAGHV